MINPELAKMPPMMTLREFAGVMESLGSYLFRHLGIADATVSDAAIARMYLDYSGAEPAPPQPMAVVIWKDKHADTTAHLFTDRVAAETWARAKGHEFDRRGEYSEQQYSDGSLGIYYGESDSLTVSDVVPDKDLSEAA
ncbi:hypothetical protein [Nocardia nova]